MKHVVDYTRDVYIAATEQLMQSMETLDGIVRQLAPLYTVRVCVNCWLILQQITATDTLVRGKRKAAITRIQVSTKYRYVQCHFI